MAGSFISAEFLNFTKPAQAQKCRQMADEANALMIVSVEPEIRDTYLDLKRQWIMLANEIDQISEASVMACP